jgi:hypothetical protein
MPQNATSTKPPAVKAAVLVRYAEGHSKAEIARRLRIDRETVTRILSEPEHKEAIEASRSRCVGLLPKAERAVERQLDKGDGDLGLRFLEKSGVLTGGSAPPRAPDVSLQVAIANLLPSMAPPAAPHVPVNANSTVAAPEATEETNVCDAEAVAVAELPLAPTQPSRPAPINIVTGRHDKWCRCRDCRADTAPDPTPCLSVVNRGPSL